jgi:hypothetical protein
MRSELQPAIRPLVTMTTLASLGGPYFPFRSARAVYSELSRTAQETLPSLWLFAAC